MRAGAATAVDLALVTGAPVVPVTVFGTRERGAGAEPSRARGSRVDMVFATPYRLKAQPWPRTRQSIREATALLRSQTVVALEDAKLLTGRDLPGTLPAEQD